MLADVLTALGQSRRFSSWPSTSGLPWKRTSSGPVGMSQRCQERTSVDHLVRTANQRWWNCHTKCFGRLKVDAENEFSRLFNRHVRHFGTSQELRNLSTTLPVDPIQTRAIG